MTAKNKKIVETLRRLVNETEYKGRAFIMGGFLRDCLLGIEPTDIGILFVATPDETMKVATEIVTKTGDFKEGVNPVRINNAVRFSIDGMMIDFTPYPNEGDEKSPREMAVHASIYYRDFEVDGMYQDLETGDVVDGTGKAVKAIMERSLATPLSNYDDIFYPFPARLYRMFRLSSKLGLEIPPAQLEYAKEKWWLANFTERERIAIEVAAIRKGDNAKAVVEQMRYAKLDPSDWTRADVFIGEGWHECEPGQEPTRYKKEPHARWTSSKSVLRVNPTVEAVELEFTKSGYSDFNSLRYACDEAEMVEKAFEGNMVRMPTGGARKITIETPVIVPAKCFATTDNRELGIYVSKINTYAKGVKVETLIDCVPYFI